MDQIKQFFCGLTHYYAVQCTRYLKFICLHFAVGYPTSNAIFSSILRWNGLVLVFKWKLRTWGIQKCPYMSQYKLPNLSYKPPNIIGPFYLIAAVYKLTFTGKSFDQHKVHKVILLKVLFHKNWATNIHWRRPQS